MSGFSNPTDAVLRNDRMFVIEISGSRGLWEVHFMDDVAGEPGPTEPSRLAVSPNPFSASTRALLDVVRADDSLGMVGNSGNTTEPHVHIQAQNRADLTAPDLVSRPMRFTNVLVDGAPVDQATPVQGQFVEQS